MRESSKQSKNTKPINANTEKALKTTVEADTFNLKLELDQKELTITLEDYVNWKAFKKVYKIEDIGKEINAKMEL